MNTATIGIIIVACAGSMLAGMAAIIKTMVLGRLDEIQSTMTGLSRDLHRLDLRITKLEAEHQMHSCIYGRGPGEDK